MSEKITFFIDNKPVNYILDPVIWEGEKDTVARTLNFSIQYDLSSETSTPVSIEVNNRVEMFEGETCLFLGYVESLSYTANSGIINVVCVDLMKRLLSSKCVGRFQGTLTELCDKICGMFSLQNGISTDNPHIHNIVSEGDLSFYDILNIACSNDFENFYLRLDGTVLTLASKEIKGNFQSDINIRNAKFTQEMSSMVTQVMVIDNQGNITNTLQNADGINTFGVLQKVYNYNTDSKDNIQEAGKLLCGVKNSATIVCNNDNACISGSYIKVKEDRTNLDGIFEIISDTHTIGENSEMTLGLKFVRMGNE